MRRKRKMLGWEEGEELLEEEFYELWERARKNHDLEMDWG